MKKDGELVKGTNASMQDHRKFQSNETSLKKIDHFKETYWLNHVSHVDCADITDQNNPQPACVTIDMSSPNIGKLMSLNHIRSTIVGHALQKIYQYTGYKTVTINHKGDTGDYLTLLVFAIQTWGDEVTNDKCPLRAFTRLLRKFHEEVDLNPELEDQIYYVNRQLAKENSAAAKILADIYKQSNQAFDGIYNRFNVHFDLNRYESAYLDQAEAWIDQMVDGGIAEADEETVTLSLEQYDLPLGLLKNSQPLYLARDIVSARDTAKKYQSDLNLYVVGNEQTTHFNQVVASLDKYTDVDADEFIHDALGYTAVLGKRHFNLKHEIKDIHDLLAKLEAELRDKSREFTFLNRDDQIFKMASNSLTYALLNQKRLAGIDLDFDTIVDEKGATALHIAKTYHLLHAELGETASSSTQDVSESFKQAIYQAYMADEPYYIAQYLNILCQEVDKYPPVKAKDIQLALNEFNLAFQLLGLDMTV